MATIVGAVAASHTPTIGFAHDASKQTDPVWAPIFEAFEPSRQWLAEQKPDALVVIYNDHISSFFLDHYSAFALGVGERWEVADEGGGVREVRGGVATMNTVHRLRPLVQQGRRSRAPHRLHVYCWSRR